LLVARCQLDPQGKLLAHKPLQQTALLNFKENSSSAALSCKSHFAKAGCKVKID
jgi:hypothetical protein